jgi:hypothetical protein
MHKRTILNLILVLFFIVVLLSCRGTHTSIRTSTNSETITPQIIFLNYSIRHNKSTGDYEILLINKIIAEGKLKMNSPEPEMSKPGDLKCIALDKHMAGVDSVIISDPLNISIESVDENNSFFRKEIALDSTQFSIRMQLNNKTTAIALKKTNSENQNSYLIVTKIK